ncbi:hypothetical protein KY348_03170 [Candidatus Woesearchaeota archaeon]|nr:hypothetical protein [Candidatus Woesearchaeota archaeon]
MKTIIFILIASLILISGCFKEINTEEVKACEFDSDCILVFSVGCCKCQTSINSDYKEYWEELEKKHKEDCEGVLCKSCGPTKVIGTECRNNTCSVLYSPVGLGMVP